jgi:RNA polymerase sigma-70 factor (ECF subfamily)
MPNLDPSSEDRAYLRLVARCLWKPGLQRRLDPSDVVQRTLAKALEKQDQFRGATAQEWRGWLRQILVRELFQELRKERDRGQGDDVSIHERSIDESSRRLEGVLEAEQTSPSQAVIRHEELFRLALALEKLPEDERTAVELKHLHDCSVRFISEQLGRTEQAVDGLLKRGRRRLRELLEGNP